MPTTATTDVYVNIKTATPSSLLLYVPTVFNIKDTITNVLTVYNEIDITDTTLSGFSNSTPLAIYYTGSKLPDSLSTVETFDVGYTQPDYYDLKTTWALSTTLLPGYTDIQVSSLIASKIYRSSTDIVSTFYTNNKPQTKINDSKVIFNIYEYSSTTETNIPVNVTISNSRYFNYLTSIISSTLGTKYINSDISIDFGRVANYPIDTYCCFMPNLATISLDCYSSIEGSGHILFDVFVSPGTLHTLLADIICSEEALYTDTINYDVRLHSLFITNFYLGVSEFTSTSSEIHVDLIDYLFQIDKTKSLFIVDGIEYTPNFVDTLNGCIMSYPNTQEFWSTTTVVCTVRAVNELGDVIEEHYYLFFGYNTEFVERIDYGFGKKIPVSFKATNFGKCPTEGFSSYYFGTKELVKADLSASIKAVESVDLPATILPSSPFFFYGSTYTVTVSGIEDYTGNKLTPIVFSFTIETPVNN